MFAYQITVHDNVSRDQIPLASYYEELLERLKDVAKEV
jgi:hypothetical protein